MVLDTLGPAAYSGSQVSPVANVPSSPKEDAYRNHLYIGPATEYCVDSAPPRVHGLEASTAPSA